MKSKLRKTLKILLICDHSIWSVQVVNFLINSGEDIRIIEWERGDIYPAHLSSWKGDWIVSFKSDLILSDDFLRRAKKGSINFHPSLPTYRGVGGYYWAIHNGDKEYGVTAHHMIRKIDAGNIIKVVKFPIYRTETPSILKDRAGAYCTVLFYEIMQKILHGQPLPVSKYKWSKKLYTYQDLQVITRWDKNKNLILYIKSDSGSQNS